MKRPRFTGKIRTDPWEALALGAKEVMESLWEEYLAELLGGSLKNARRQRIRREIEVAAGYADIYRAWNELPPEERATAWQRLIQAARSQKEALQGTCVRCGECCQQGGPSLTRADLGLFQRGVVSEKEVYPLRVGEVEIRRDGSLGVVKAERLKIREVPGTRQCLFYQAATGVCRIYPDRPRECRNYFCFQPETWKPGREDYLTRADILAGVEEIRELQAAHEERCDLLRLRESLQEVRAGKEEAGEVVFEALHFDHYLRKLLREDWGLAREQIDFVLGRPLAQFLKDLGIQATLTPEGVFRLTPKGEG